MQAEIITIGDEILIGQIVDTNSAWMSEQLNMLGIRVYEKRSVSDSKQHILNALAETNSRSQVVLITGGLGPTSDDITKPVLCEYFGGKMMMNNDVLSDVQNLLKHRGKPMLEANIKQAEVPDCCKVLRNGVGTAPGMWFEKSGTIFVSMPGVPYEMKYLMETHVIPMLRKRFTLPAIVHKTIQTTGLPESMLAAAIAEWENALPEHIKLAYLPSPGLIRLRLSAYGNDYAALNADVEKHAEGLKKYIADNIFGYGNDTLSEVVGRTLKQNNKTVSVAESCTGGYLAHLITTVSGSSAYFKGSITAYDNAVKTGILGVDANTIAQHGAVSTQVVEQMATRVRLLLQTDYGIATSGIAGPDGGTDEKPVGTICIAVAHPNGVISKQLILTTSRERNIQMGAIVAINMLRLLMKN